MRNYFPHDWYWLADDRRVYASARQTILTDEDSGFQAAKALGNFTLWPKDESGEQSEDALLDVLSPRGLYLDAKTAKIAVLTACCATTIKGGYRSDALGSQHIYPSSASDQINMMGSVTASLLPDIAADWETPFWVRDEEGQWSFKMHTASQIQQAGRDGKAHVIECQCLLAALTSEVMNAASREDVWAVDWPRGRRQ